MNRERKLVRANHKVVLIVFLGAGACLSSFILSQYFAKKNHDNQVLLDQIRQLAPRVEHIRLLSRNFIQSGDSGTWAQITEDLESLNLDIKAAPRASRRWIKEIRTLKKYLAAYRTVLNRVHDPAVGLKGEKVQFQEISLSFTREVENRILVPYREEEALQLYNGRLSDPFKIRIKETAYNVVGLHLQQQLILLELLSDWDLAGYNRKKGNIAKELARHKTQLRYMNILMGNDPGIEPIIDSLNQKMDRLVNYERVILSYFDDLIQLSGNLATAGVSLLQASENLTGKIISEISAANRLNQMLSWWLLVPILGGLGILGAMLARDIIHFVQDLETGREALRESEERLYLALSGASEGVWDWNIDSNTLHFNEGYYKISGYAPNEFPATYEEWEKRVHPNDIQQVKAFIDDYLSGDIKNFDIEFRFLRSDGGYMWIQDRGKIVARNDRGEPTRFVGTHSDITRRKQMEESLRLTQFIFDKAPISIWRMGAAGEVLDVNEQCCASLGYSRKELRRMTVFDFAPGFGPDEWADSTNKLNESETKTTESVYRRKSGDVFPIQVIENLMRFEDRVFRVAFVQDITKRKQAEEELRRLRNYLASIIDSMPSVLVGVDSGGRVTLWNRQAEQATGLNGTEAYSQPLTEVFPCLGKELTNIQTAIRDQQVVRDLKVPRSHRDGTRYDDVTIYPLVDSGADGAVIRVDDVTERVRMEEMMIQGEKMLSVGGLAAGMAHEINNPLAGILQSIAVLSNRLQNDMPANRKAAESAGTTMAAIRHYAIQRKLPTMLENIRTSGKLAADIVRNMLSFARKDDQVLSRRDLGELLDQTLELLKTDYDMKKHYDFKQIKIMRQFDKAAPSILCESSKIQQVFMNILKNGAEAMAENTSTDRLPVFILRVQAENGWVRVEIEDNGPGMDEAIRRRIFEPFFTTKAVGRGTGLGLSVSYFIITENHGGEMDARAVDGGGTRFVIRLPKTRAKNS